MENLKGERIDWIYRMTARNKEVTPKMGMQTDQETHSKSQGLKKKEKKKRVLLDGSDKLQNQHLTILQSPPPQTHP